MTHQQNKHDGTDAIVTIPGRGIVQAAGDTKPTDGTAGYSPGCTFHKLNGGNNTAYYVNEGTITSCDFNLVAADVPVDFTGLTSTIAELNKLTGVTATPAELNAAAVDLGRAIISTATTVAITVATHAGRVLLAQGTANSTYTYTLPAATGTGAVFVIHKAGMTTTVTQGTHIITVTGTDAMRGVIAGLHNTSTAGGVSWVTTNGTSITLNFTTKGGIYGDRFEFVDAATGVYTLNGVTVGSGTLATPIS